MSVLKTNFILKSVSGNEKPILLVLNFGYKEFDALKSKTIYKPLKYYTGVKVSKLKWDKNNKLPLEKTKLKELLQIEQIAKDVFTALSLKGKKIKPELFKYELDVKLKGMTETTKVIRIAEYIKEVIVKTDKNRSVNTLKEYNKLANKLESFEEDKKMIFTTENLDEELYLLFIHCVRNEVTRINAVWAVDKTFKAVLNEISRKYKIDVFNPATQLAKSDRVMAVKADKLYLTYEHIQKIIKYDAPSERLKNTKLILMTLLFTGCRFSDVYKIKPEFTYSKNGFKFRYTRFISLKTSTETIVPILKPLEDAYKANGGNVPYEITSSKFNLYVKELVKNAGLEDNVTISFTNSFGKKEFEEKEFSQFVSSHIGRRSFITNLINYVPITILTKITGHTLKDKNIIFGYNKISLLDNAALFVKELKRISDVYKEEFPIKLV